MQRELVLVYRMGSDVGSPTVEQLIEALSELSDRDDEHPDTWLDHPTGWKLSIDQGGYAVWTNFRQRVAPRCMRLGSPDDALALWIRLANGDIASIESEPWQDGRRPKPDAPTWTAPT